MPWIQRDGVRLHYLDVGQGQPVLLLHAFPLSAEMFRPQLEALGSRHRFIVPDLRGLGHSELGAGPTLMETLAADALAALDDAKVPAAVVGGVSMGGYAAMALLRLDAGRVRGLILADTQALADDDEGRRRREETALSVLDKGMGSLAEAMTPKLLSSGASAAVVAEVRRLILENSPQGAAAASRGMALRLDSRDILARFGGPALVVHGDSDALIPRERHEQMAGLLPHARLVAIPKAGHLANLEAPMEFNRTLEEFLGTSAPRNA